MQHAVLEMRVAKEQVMAEKEAQMKVRLEARWAEVEEELQVQLMAEGVEQMVDWSFLRQCEQLEQQSMARHQEEGEALAVQVLIVEVEEEPGQQQTGEVEEALDLMKQEGEVVGQKVSEIQVVLAVLAGL